MVSQLAPGDRILDYVLLEHVGSGGFGDVFRAEHGVLRKTVAIKIPRDEEFVRALGVEGALQHGLEHAGIVRTVEAHLSHDPPFLALDYVDGPSLRALVDAPEPIAPERALRLAEGMAEALAHAHAQGVVHGDFKPENVLIARASTDEEAVRLTDFGLGRVLEGVQGSFLISRSLANAARRGAAAAGTLRYIAPEVLEGEPIEPAADVWAFGVVLFEMLTGATPAGGEAPSALSEGVHPAIDELFFACWTRRARRVADGAALLARVKAARAALAAPAAPARDRPKEPKVGPVTAPLPDAATAEDGADDGAASEFDRWRDRLLNGVRRRLLARTSIAVVNPRGLDLGVGLPPGGPRHQVLLSVADRLDAKAASRLLSRAERIWERHKGLWECEVTFVVVARDVPEPEKVLWDMRGFALGWWRRRRVVLIDIGRDTTHTKELGAELRSSALRKDVVTATVDAADQIRREDSPQPATAGRRKGAPLSVVLATLTVAMATCLLVKTAIVVAIVAGLDAGSGGGWIGSIEQRFGIDPVAEIEVEPEPDVEPEPAEADGPTVAPTDPEHEGENAPRSY